MSTYFLEPTPCTRNTVCCFGVTAFGANIRLSTYVAPLITLGPLLFVSLGMLVGTVTETQGSAGVIGNIMTLPMIFL